MMACWTVIIHLILHFQHAFVPYLIVKKGYPALTVQIPGALHESICVVLWLHM